MAGTRKADFLSQAKSLFRREEVELPKGMTMKAYVRTLSAAESRALTESCLREGKSVTDDDAFDDDRLQLSMLSAALVGEDGERLIPDGREHEINDLPQQVIVAVNQAFARLNEPAGN